MSKTIRYSLITILLLGVGYWGWNGWKKKTSLGIPITIEATFMMYACGDDNDDMKVEKVSDPHYSFLLRKDINPETEDIFQTMELKNYFYDNRTNQYGTTYRLKGRLEKDLKSGCDSVPRFYVKEIERLDGTHRLLKN